MGQSYETIQSRLAIDGIQRVRVAKKCTECGQRSVLISRNHKPVTCFACSLKEKKLVRALVVAGLLLLITGCQSPPRKANIEIQIAGQTVKMNIAR